MAVTPFPRRRSVAALAAIVVTLSLLTPTVTAHAASSIGSLDPAFGTAGRLELVGTTPGMRFAPLVLPDGRFRLIETTATGITILRGFLANGAPDTAFGSSGAVSFARGTNPRAMTLNASGDIVLTGTITTSSGNDELIMRRLPNGGPDGSFGTNGRVIVSFLDTADVDAADTGCGVAVDGQGRTVVAGDTVLPSTTSTRTALTVVRLLSDGTADATFGSNGTRIFKRNPHLFLCSSGETDVRPQTDGSIVLAGEAQTCTVVRLTKGGALDTKFDGTGIEPIDAINENWGFGRTCRMTTDPLGRIVVVGRSDHLVRPSRFNVGIVRLLVNGALDPGFRGGGATEVDMFGGDDVPEGVLVDDSGSIVVSSRTSRLGRQPDAGLLRLQDDGAVDASFGDGGRLATDLTAADTNDDVIGTAELPTGGLLLLGGIVTGTGTQIPVVARYGPVELDTSEPVSQIGRPVDGATYGRLGMRVVRGTADDSLSMIRRTSIAVRAVRTDGTCRWLRKDGAFVRRACDDPLWLRVTGTYLWHKRLPTLLPFSQGTSIKHYNVYSRAVDLAGNTETTFDRGRNNISFEIGP